MSVQEDVICNATLHSCKWAFRKFDLSPPMDDGGGGVLLLILQVFSHNFCEQDESKPLRKVHQVERYPS